MTSPGDGPAGPLLPKAPTGIRGLDEIIKGGLPGEGVRADHGRRRARQDAAGAAVPGRVHDEPAAQQAELKRIVGREERLAADAQAAWPVMGTQRWQIPTRMMTEGSDAPDARGRWQHR